MTVPLAAIALSSTALAAALVADPSLGLTAQGMQWGGGSGPPPPVFPPQISGINATIAADFVGGQYWAAGAAQPDFNTWLTAIGGTFSRASSATYIDGSGVIQTVAANTPRFPPGQGIRLTGALTNLVFPSNAWNGGTKWANSGASSVAGIIGPDGLTGLKVIEDTSTNQHYAAPPVFAVTSGTVYTWSIYVAKGTRSWCLAQIFGATTGTKNAFFNFDTGVFGSIASGVTANAVQLANGFWRISITFTAAASENINQYASLASANGTLSYTGTGTDFMYLMGGSLSATSYPIDYIPTTTVAVTQAADSMSYPPVLSTTPAQLTVSAGFTGPPITASNKFPWSIGASGSAANQVVLSVTKNLGNFDGQVALSGAVMHSVTTTPPTVGVNHKWTLTAQSNNIRSSIDAGAVIGLTGTSVVMPTVVTETIGVSAFGAGTELNANMQSFAEWGLFASDADLQRLST